MGVILKVEILEAKYEQAKLEFPGGMGVQNKKPSVGGVWIFSGIAHCIHANTRSTKIGRRLEIFSGSQQNRVSNIAEPPRAVTSRLYFGLQ